LSSGSKKEIALPTEYRQRLIQDAQDAATGQSALRAWQGARCEALEEAFDSATAGLYDGAANT